MKYASLDRDLFNRMMAAWENLEPEDDCIDEEADQEYFEEDGFEEPLTTIQGKAS